MGTGRVSKRHLASQPQAGLLGEGPGREQGRRRGAPQS